MSLFELRKAIGAIWLQLDLSVQTKNIIELLPPFCRTLSSAIGFRFTTVTNSRDQKGRHHRTQRARMPHPRRP